MARSVAASADAMAGKKSAVRITATFERPIHVEVLPELDARALDPDMSEGPSYHASL